MPIHVPLKKCIYLLEINSVYCIFAIPCFIIDTQEACSDECIVQLHTIGKSPNLKSYHNCPLSIVAHVVKMRFYCLSLKN